MDDYTLVREAMVDCQVRPSDVTRHAIINAMLEVPRERFVPPSQKSVAYVDEDIPLRKGRSLLAPRVFAKMLDTLEIEPHETVLDIGCALGYSSAVIARMCRGVVAVESDQTMFASAETTLASLAVDNVAVVNGPLEAGLPDEGPFDVIIIEGGIGAEPVALYDQLRDGGRLIAIWGSVDAGQARLSVKTGDEIATRWIFDASAQVLPGFEAKPAFAF